MDYLNSFNLDGPRPFPGPSGPLGALGNSSIPSLSGASSPLRCLITWISIATFSPKKCAVCCLSSTAKWNPILSRRGFFRKCEGIDVGSLPARFRLPKELSPAVWPCADVVCAGLSCVGESCLDLSYVGLRLGLHKLPVRCLYTPVTVWTPCT